jgi:uncharacterized protein (TIGR02594 family)
MTDAHFRNPPEDEFSGPAFPSHPDPADPPWLKNAFGDLGVKEVPGKGTHPRIAEMHRNTSLKATGDEVSWCSSAVNTWMVEAGKKGTDSAAARSWLSWGLPVEAPRRGDVVVFWRGSPDSWQGHVALVLAHDGRQMVTIGGNQSNAVTIARPSTDRVLGYRRAP